ncbi:hypothetical protein NQ314_004891, partial [Rhamnusium bicolor]
EVNFLGSSGSLRTRTYTGWSPVDEGVTIAWSDLSVSTRIKKRGRFVNKRIINGVSGAIKAGTLVALMGSRQAGTMDVEGDILINGRPIGDYMKYVSGYMHQEDIFVPSLTVLEHMVIMASLKLDRRISAEEKERKIYDILNQLGLGKCGDTRIGGIGQSKALSGGEKKRLAFATELLTDPPVLFCDEPTTGLDSYSARKLVMMLSQMASNGKTILCTIHQPSTDIFAMFSQLILVAEGRIAYMGASSCAIDFFENKELYWWSKLYWLTYRWFTEILRDPSVQILKVIQRIITAVIVGLCCLGTNQYTQSGIQSVQGALFIFVTENTFNPMYSVLAEFPENTPIFLREYKSGLYHSSTYFLSRIISLVSFGYFNLVLPGFVLEPVLFTIITYWLAGLRSTVGAFFMTVFITTLTMNVASACGIMFSNAFDSVPTAMSCLVPFDYTLMVTSGLFIKLSTLPSLLTWTKYLSWLMYATESLSIVQWKGVSNITCETEQDTLPCITEGSIVLEKYSFSEEHLSRDIWIMIFLLLSFYIIGYLCLWWKTKNK